MDGFTIGALGAIELPGGGGIAGLYEVGGGSMPESYDGMFARYELGCPLRGAEVFTISVSRAGGIFGVPHCPQNASSWLTSLPHPGHFITTSFFLVACCSNSSKENSTCAHYSVFTLIWLLSGLIISLLAILYREVSLS